MVWESNNQIRKALNDQPLYEHAQTQRYTALQSVMAPVPEVVPIQNPPDFGQPKRPQAKS